ncbi:MAG: MFS transporter [Chlamydiota bacterium]
MVNSYKQLRWVVWGLATAFFFYEFFLRVAPSVMLNQLTTAFHIDAALVGTLSAGYLYVYAPMQVPVGILIDRYGARTLLTLGTVSCGVGSIIFGLAETYDIALLGRGLMGFGSSFAFVGMVYVGSHWFSHTMLPLLVGMGNSFGMMGALWGEDALGLIITHYSWRAVSIYLGIVGILLGVMIVVLFFFVPNHIKPKHERAETFSSVWRNLKVVCVSKETWLNAIISLMMYATTTGFASLWGVNFVKVAYGLDIDEAAFLVSLVFLGWMMGGPLTGYVAERLFSRKYLLMISSFLAGICISLAIYVTTFSEIELSLIFILVGVFSSSQLLTFSYAVDINPNKAKGTAIALTNFLVMITGSAIQPFVGYLMDLHSGHISDNGTSTLVVEDYQFAFYCFPLSFFLSFVLCFFLKPEEELT